MREIMEELVRKREGETQTIGHLAKLKGFGSYGRLFGCCVCISM